MVPWANPSPHPKRHLDWFSHFCRAHDYDRQINQETDHASLSVTIGHIYIVLWCGLKVLTVLPETVSDAELIDPGMIDETDDSGWNLICSSCIALNNTTSVSLHLNVQLISPIYTIQPVVKPVWQLGKILYTRYNRLSNPLTNRFDKRLYCVYSLLSNRLYNPVWQPVERTVAVRLTRLSNRLSNPFDNRVECLFARYSRLSNRLYNHSSIV